MSTSTVASGSSTRWVWEWPPGRIVGLERTTSWRWCSRWAHTSPDTPLPMMAIRMLLLLSRAGGSSRQVLNLALNSRRWPPTACPSPPPDTPADVFEYLARFSNAAYWDPGVSSAEDITPGPPAYGSTYRLVVRFLGLSVPLEYRIEEIDTPKRVVLRAENSMVRSTDVIEVRRRRWWGLERDLRGHADAEGRVRGARPRCWAWPSGASATGPPPGCAPPWRHERAPVGRPPVARTGRRRRRRGHGRPELQPGWASRCGAGSRPGTSRPRMDGRVVVVTGATSGIGLAAATALAGLGATVHLVGRDADRAATGARRRRGGRSGPGPRRPGRHGRPRCRGRVRVAAVRERYDRVDALIHNAGALTRSYQATPGGVELTVATQVLGPYVLTATLAPLLWGSPPATIVTVSSGGMYTQRFDLDRLEMGQSDYDGVAAYARAKRAQVVLAHAWARRFAPAGVASFAMHPGWVDTPGSRPASPGSGDCGGPCCGPRPRAPTPSCGWPPAVLPPRALALGVPAPTVGVLPRPAKPIRPPASPPAADTPRRRRCVARLVRGPYRHRDADRRVAVP